MQNSFKLTRRTIFPALVKQAPICVLLWISVLHQRVECSQFFSKMSYFFSPYVRRARSTTYSSVYASSYTKRYSAPDLQNLHLQHKICAISFVLKIKFLWCHRLILTAFLYRNVYRYLGRVKYYCVKSDDSWPMGLIWIYQYLCKTLWLRHCIRIYTKWKLVCLLTHMLNKPWSRWQVEYSNATVHSDNRSVEIGQYSMKL